MAETIQLKANCWTHGTGLRNRRTHSAETTNQHSLRCDRQRIDQSGGSQQVAAAAFSSLGLSRPPVSRFGGENKNFSIYCVLFVFEIIIFYNFHENFYLGQKKGDKETKERIRTAATSPIPRPVAPLFCPCREGLKGHVGKRRAKGLKSTVGITTLRRVVFAMRTHVYVLVKKTWHST
jgi:hypothetical protein